MQRCFKCIFHRDTRRQRRWQWALVMCFLCLRPRTLRCQLRRLALCKPRRRSVHCAFLNGIRMNCRCRSSGGRHCGVCSSRTPATAPLGPPRLCTWLPGMPIRGLHLDGSSQRVCVCTCARVGLYLGIGLLRRIDMLCWRPRRRWCGAGLGLENGLGSGWGFHSFLLLLEQRI